jgi:hypothetical protein
MLDFFAHVNFFDSAAHQRALLFTEEETLINSVKPKSAKKIPDSDDEDDSSDDDEVPFTRTIVSASGPDVTIEDVLPKVGEFGLERP